MLQHPVELPTLASGVLLLSKDFLGKYTGISVASVLVDPKL